MKIDTDLQLIHCIITCGIITIGFSSASGIRSCRRSRLKISVIFRYAGVDVDPLDELDADELGEKLLSMPYLLLPAADGCWGFSSPAGLSRLSIVPPSIVLYVSAVVELSDDSD